MDYSTAIKKFLRKTMRILLFLVFILILPGMNNYEDNNSLLQWAIIIRDVNTKEDLSTIKNEIDLKSNQSFKFIFNPGENVFTYLYHYSNEEELDLLYPDNIDILNSSSFNIWHDIPRGLFDWFELDLKQPGEDIFYFIVSVHRLKELEELTSKYINDKNNKFHQNAVLEKILILIKNNYHEEKIVEPVPITGLIKTDNTIIYDVSGVEFYSKVIIIKPILDD